MSLIRNEDYRRFLEAKVCQAPTFGFDVPDSAVNPILKPHQRAIVRWMVRGGRRACFAAFGLGKSVMQLEAVRLTLGRVGGRGLIVVPLGVRQEFIRDAAMLGTPVRFIRRIEEADETGIHLTNYETVRDGKLDPRLFKVASIDEAAILIGLGGSKTFREFMRLFAGDDRSGAQLPSVPYRFVATATPSPNEYIEILAYAAFLDVMDISAAKTRFFKRDSTKADNLTLHVHKEAEFWLWVASWAIFATKPSDVDPSFSDDGYDLPPLDVRWHEIRSDHSTAGHESDGQARLYKNAALGVVQASREKRDSLGDRVAKMMEIVNESPADHFILWHDLEDERRAIAAALPTVLEVYGSQDLDEREANVATFAAGGAQYLAGKPVMLGSGTNLQAHCHREIFLGIGYKFRDFIQAIHRTFRFLQRFPVRIDIIHTEAEREVRRVLERKWAQHNEQVNTMTEIIRKHGLSQTEALQALTRSMGVERVEVAGDGYQLVNADCVDETTRMADNSVGLVLTSIPFSTQYEYSPNYADFGHTDDNAHFWRQMDFLTPQLLRVLQPGRIAAIHVKDRLIPAGMTGTGCQEVYPLHMKAYDHFSRHGFAYLGMKTIVTDVVRENNQTYRLGWTEQCKDGTKMGVGMPEYLLLFRKPPTEKENLYADVPVVKAKRQYDQGSGHTAGCQRDEGCACALVREPGWNNEDGYSRSRWQIDAHGFTRSSGNRPLRPEDVQDLPHDQIFQVFKRYGLERVYDFEHHVRLGEALEARMRLPVTFMLLQPPSWSAEVWADVARMLTLNTAQAQKGLTQHLCPMPIDIARRVIVQMSNKGDVVYDPFGGLMTVPYIAIEQGRKAVACELSKPYFLDGVSYVRAMVEKVTMPTLFDLPEFAGDVAVGE